MDFSKAAVRGEESRRGLQVSCCDANVGYNVWQNHCWDDRKKRASAIWAEHKSGLSPMQMPAFAAGENEKSHSGAAVAWGDCPVIWATQRQSTVALSTAEAELHASIEGATMIQSCTPGWDKGGVTAKSAVYRFCINMFNSSISCWKLQDEAPTDSGRGCKVSCGPWIFVDCTPSGRVYASRPAN